RGVGQLAQAALELRAVSREPRIEAMLVQQIERPSHVSRCDVVADRAGEVAKTLVPRGSSAVECASPRRVASIELGAQEVTEQVVVAKALAISVERDQEEAQRFDEPEELPAVGSARELIAQRAVEVGEDGRGEQEVLDLRWLTLEYLAHQEVRDVAVVASEATQEARRIVDRPQAERRELNAGGPSLGSLHECVDIIRR